MSRIPVRAGLARYKMELQETTQSRDSMGGVTDSWCKNQDVYCDLRPLSASERVSGDQIMQAATHRIRIRAISGLRITPSMRLILRGRDCANDRIFNIQWADNALQGEPATELLVVEDLNAS